MKVLAIDTSTEILSLCGRSDRRSFEVTRDLDIRHVEQILPLIDMVLSGLSIEARDLDLVVTAWGPGSFTGLRIGMAVSKGLCAGSGCPCVSIPTLDAYAAPFRTIPDIVVAPVIDAKKNHVYTAFYRKDERLTDYLDLSVPDFLKAAEGYLPVFLTGPHRDLIRSDEGSSRFFTDPLPRAGKSGALLELGITAFLRGERDDISAGPLYVRASEAEQSLRGGTDG
jgi:tRNA threonylcarbamoyladenosine biosynthesis protein TsaB